MYNLQCSIAECWDVLVLFETNWLLLICSVSSVLFFFVSFSIAVILRVLLQVFRDFELLDYFSWNFAFPDQDLCQRENLFRLTCTWQKFFVELWIPTFIQIASSRNKVANKLTSTIAWPVWRQYHVSSFTTRWQKRKKVSKCSAVKDLWRVQQRPLLLPPFVARTWGTRSTVSLHYLPSRYFRRARHCLI